MHTAGSHSYFIDISVYIYVCVCVCVYQSHLYTYICVCVCVLVYICQSPNSSHPPPFPSWCPHICSLCICLYFCQKDFIYCVTWLIQEFEDSVEIQFTISLRVHHIETVVDT